VHCILLQLGLCPDPAGGANSAPWDLAGFKGPTSKGGRGRGMQRHVKGRKEGREGR